MSRLIVYARSAGELGGPAFFIAREGGHPVQITPDEIPFLHEALENFALFAAATTPTGGKAA